jgi:hypothetical protein
VIVVNLPAELVATSTNAFAIADSHTDFNDRLSNYFLKVTAACNGVNERHSLRRAYLTVGKFALFDEKDMGMSFLRQLVWFYRGCRGTSWSLGRAIPLPALPDASIETLFTKARSSSDSTRAGTVSMSSSTSPTAEELPIPAFSSVGLSEFAPPPGFSLPDDVVPLDVRSDVVVQLDSQQGSFSSGASLSSITVSCTGTPMDNVSPDGAREAVARFPQLSAKPSYLFSNNIENLVAAEKMRNVGVGGPDSIYSSLPTTVLIAQLFTRERINAALSEYDGILSGMPAKMSDDKRHAILAEALECDAIGGDGYSRQVAAFVKAEVSAKPKPRPIANHGPIRMAAVVRTAFVFEHVLFGALSNMCVKHVNKNDAIAKMALTMNRYDGTWLENDLTAFEFGIGEKLKGSEVSVFRHLENMCGTNAEFYSLFERVMQDRTGKVEWVKGGRDVFGEMIRNYVKLPNCMRESGDRFTSSGNFWQNLIAWLEHLVKPVNMKAAVQSLIASNGAWFTYTSDRDDKKYHAYLAFEGDDTFAKLEEFGAVLSAEKFLLSRGWKPKIRIAADRGYDYVRFIGIDILIHEGKALSRSGSVICMPEIVRILTTKSWTTSSLRGEQLSATVRVYACVMAEQFKHFLPMHAFFSALYASHETQSRTVDLVACRQMFITANGYVPSDSEILAFHKRILDDGLPAYVGGHDDEYNELARVAAGDFSNDEYSTMCSLTTLTMHGSDLATYIPRSWL